MVQEKGFTLAETVLVLALSGIVVCLLTLSMPGLAPKFRLTSGVWEIHTCLNEARFKAILTGTDVRVCFKPQGYNVEAYDEEAKSWRLARHGLVEGVEIAANNTPTFHPEGTVSDLASITVSNPRGSYKITIAISGRIKVAKLI